MNTAHHTLNTAHHTLNTTHNTLHNAHNTLITAHNTLNNVHHTQNATTPIPRDTLQPTQILRPGWTLDRAVDSGQCALCNVLCKVYTS